MMSEVTKFRNEDIPYEGIAKLGVSPEDISNLPQEFRRTLLNGEVTPMFEARIPTSNGREVVLPLRMQLVSENGLDKPRLVVFPLRPEIENTLGLSKYEMERVQSGDVVLKELSSNGRRFPEFIQLDPRTNSLVHQKVAALPMEQELANMESIKDIQLGSQQKDAIREGRPVELNVGDEKVVVGVDLKEPQGFKVIKGDMEEWKRQQEERYDIAHPEFMGFVKTDRNRWEYQQVVKAQGQFSERNAANERLSNKAEIKL